MKTTNLLFLTFLTYLLGLSNLAAKDVSQISGKITDQNENSVPYANVALIDATSGNLVGGAVSDENGVFLIESTKTAKVKLVISSIGFAQFESEVFALAPGLIKEFGTVAIQDEMTGLDEVTVKSSRPEIIIEPDKTVINVEGTVMAEGSNALDIIGRSPGIYVDQDGIINLNGRTGATVMINDRLTYMSATDLANFLRAMPADNIKSIEVINNPSARFDAEGSAGVINIKLKKNTVDGIFGNIQAGALYNGQWLPNTGVSLNVKKGKWSTNANLNYNHYGNYNDLEINRNFVIPEGVSNFFQDSRITTRNKNLFFNGAANYEINENQNIALNVQASDSKDTDDSNSLTDIITPGISEISYLDSKNNSVGVGNRIFVNLHYDAKLDTLGTKISSDIDFTRMNSDSESLLTNMQWVGENTSDVMNSRILTLNDMYYNIFTAKVDFVKPVGKGNTIETGVKGSWVMSDNNLDLSKSQEDGPLVPDPSSNSFIYNENVLAAYISYKGKFSEKLSYQAGLRGEYSDITGNSVTLNQVNNQKYFNLFPSAFLQHKISDNYQIVYNVNRRITRPNYRLLNPFVYYIDPLTTERGNPNLKPQYSNNLEMNHVVKGAYQFTLGYSETEDAFMQVFVQNEEERTTTTYTDNFDKTRNANFRAIIPVDIKEWWTTSNMVQVNYNQYKSQIGDDYLDVSNTSFMVRSQHNLTLPLGFKAEVMGIYLGPQIWGQGEIAGFGWVDAGVTKSIMKDKITLSVNGTDLFRTQVIKANVDFAAIDTNFRQYRSNQGVRFTLKYNFSKGESFRVKSNSGSSEERNRLD
ncbi:TonB-dependent receptor domain-containing protein [Algoriphagus antarcticus]|uniref:Outer membrane receptor protein involved in Fe transport n=1 Tax=Algoriphagus antarcticus TaxID=238540 RepID=A0A3E0DYH4_9BACT|nr:TonB-dependent receptor [Algoriphagus antarcticus]REG87131.1 outer membrane receptor protein involved in Fe transport [Algoriphagus antarcticus]